MTHLMIEMRRIWHGVVKNTRRLFFTGRPKNVGRDIFLGVYFVKMGVYFNKVGVYFGKMGEWSSNQINVANHWLKK